MIYRTIGVMSGSSLDGIDLVFVEFHVDGKKWSYEILAADCFSYSDEWTSRLADAVELNARDYLLLHSEYGHHLGKEINRFIEEKNLHYQVGLISSHGHTSFHIPQKLMTAQLGDGASIAAETRLPVISDLRALDVAFGGQGAPIVPMGEKLLFPEHSMFLNLGGIANISIVDGDKRIAFDICPANRVLNMLAAKTGVSFDKDGALAAEGNINTDLLAKLNDLAYYNEPTPKSLANDFGTDVVYPLIRSFGLTHNDELRTYVEHIVIQISEAVSLATGQNNTSTVLNNSFKMMVTGGGALNKFLIARLTERLLANHVEVEVPAEMLVNYKEAIVMALLGVLRWRMEYTVLSSVTGAGADSIGGAVWIGQDA